jgi:hypothetical protein
VLFGLRINMWVAIASALLSRSESCAVDIMALAFRVCLAHNAFTGVHREQSR